MHLLERYTRQLKILSDEGQRKLKNSTVLIVGVGGLGSASSVYLAYSGIGKLLVVDKDKIEKSNLNRQILYKEEDVGKYKAIIAAERLREINKEIHVEPFVIDVNDENFEEIIKRADVVVDGLDNWKARLRVNKLAVRYLKPFVHAAVEEWYGQLFTVIPKKGPCLNCIFGETEETKKEIQVVPPLPGILGTMQAIEVIKIITGIGKVASDRIIYIDSKNLSIHEIQVTKDPNCKICSY
ncbi:HesA/MoeB/ThiF family protein [Fervidicoccus fontis]|uniref:HesA/MoeB/ThiF family protein n=1 Tax=Fervidicoccus fontis TaxID=683846 RepID=UPI0023552C25|nr:HesA/MoeB/ThiF family protein [Fervidicoccus fontis]